jgi:chromosomal replication initiation ATPase DnaA
MTPHIYAGISTDAQALYSNRAVKLTSRTDINSLIHYACSICNCTEKQLENGSRLQQVINAKRMLCYVLYTYYGYSFKKTATALKLKEHATAMHHYRRFNELLSINDKNTLAMFKTLRHRISINNVTLHHGNN